VGAPPFAIFEGWDQGSQLIAYFVILSGALCRERLCNDKLSN